MLQHEIPTATTTALVSTFAPASSVALVTIATYHCYSVYKHFKTKQSDESKCALSLKLTFALLINGILCDSTLVLLLPSAWSNITFCKSILLIGPPLYVIYKLWMYLILTQRAKEYFGNSAFAYSNKKLRIFQYIIILWSILNAISTMLLSTITVADNPKQVPRCDGVLYPPFVISMILLDIFSGIGSSYLLIRPMMQMHKMEHSSNDPTKTSIFVKIHSDCSESNPIFTPYEFRRIAKKQAILSGISVSTSWFALMAVILTNMHLVFVSLDFVVSTLSVILIYSWNEWIFDRLCCCFMMKKEAISVNDIKNLEQAIVKSSEESESGNNVKTEVVEIVTRGRNSMIIH